MEGETVAAPEIVYGRGLTCGAFGCHNEAVVMDYTVGSTVCLEHLGAVARLSADRERLTGTVARVIGSLETGAFVDGANGPSGFENVDHAVEWTIGELKAVLDDLREEVIT